MSRITLQLLKYGEVCRVTFRNQLAYVAEVWIRTLFLLVILFIFVQLWRVTYAVTGEKTIGGYTFEQLIWYLIFSESIIMASPRLTVAVEEDVKTGGIAYLLSRPMSYVLYHYSSYMGEAAVRLTLNLVMGSLLGLVLFGPPAFGWGWLAFWPVVAGAFTVNYVLRMIVALCAFWVEETQGLVLLYDKLLFTIGGMMLPLELFPEALRRVCDWLPFQAVVYFAAKTAVQFDWQSVGRMLAVQVLWTVGLGFVLAAVYRKGVTKLNVNGG